MSNISQFLTNQQADNLSDLVLDKIQYFLEKSKISDWPPAESIKTQNLHRLSLFVYNNLKLKNTIETSGSKCGSELLHKNIMNSSTFLEGIFENNNFSFFSDEYTFTLFQDWFNVYLKFLNLKEKGETTNEEVTETLRTTLNILDEEISNINKSK